MSSILRLSLFLALLLSATLTLTLTPTPATAAGDDAALTDQARKLMKEGIAHFREKDYEKARAALTAAWAIKKHHQIAGALGTAELKTGRFRDAAEHLHYYIENLGPDANPTDREKTSAYLQEAKAKVGLLHVSASVPNATIKLGDRTLAADELDPLFVDPGTHNLKADHDGYDPGRATVQIEAGAEKTVKLELARTVEGGGGINWVVFGVGAGLTVAAVGAAVGMTVAASGAQSDQDNLNAQLTTKGATGDSRCVGVSGEVATLCGDLETAYGDQATFTNASTGLWIAAGGLALATGVYAIVAATTAGGGEEQSDSEPAAAQFRFLPIVSPQGAMGLVEARF